MKIFNNTEDCIKYLGVSEAYFNQELNDFLGNQGSEIFESKEDISYNNFKYNGFKIDTETEQFEVFVASVKVDEDTYECCYCIE